MNSAKVFARIFSVGAHAAFADNNTDAGLLNEFLFKFFHTHAGGRTNGYHFKFVVAKGTDNRTGMQDCLILNVNRQLAAIFYDTAMCNVTAGGNIAVQINNVANMNIL